MATIKACPCCGTPAKLFENHYGTIAEYWVICPECRLGTTWHPTEAEAIAAWNQRACCASCREDAVASALAVEQRNYDQAQEIKALRKLREACEAVRAGVQDGMMWMEYSEQAAMLANKRWARWREALAACDEASAPTGDEHK